MTEPSAGRDATAPDIQISLLALGNTLLRRRRTIAAWAVGGAVLGLALAFASRRVYTASATFIPQASENISASGLALAASQLGIRMPTGNQSWGPPVYVELLHARVIMDSIALDSVAVPEEGGRRASVMDLLEVEAPTPARRVEKAVRSLREVLSASEDKDLSAVKLAATTRWPSVSFFLAHELVRRVNLFNMESRRTQATAERQFAEAQAADAEHALHEAEDRLQTFVQHNRDIEGSPDLQVQRDRLQREVNLRQQVYTTLVQNREEARIREVRDTPVITVLEAPTLPVLPESRRAFLKAFLGGAAGAMLAVLLVLAGQRMAEVRRSPHEEAREFLGLLQGATPRFLRRGGR